MSAQGSSDFNAKQQRFADLAVRESHDWSAADFDARVLIIESRREQSGRSLALYRSGVTGDGVRVALVDPSASKGLRWISQKDARALIVDGRL